MNRVGWYMVGLFLSVALGMGVLVAMGTSESDSQSEMEQEWLEFVEDWKVFVGAKADGTIVEDPGEWKEICYTDKNFVSYTYENVSLADLPEDKKRWFAFEGSMPYDIRQLFLTRYTTYMTDEERAKVRSVITSPEFLERYFSLSGEEKHAIWDSILWNKTFPEFKELSTGGVEPLGYIDYEWGRNCDGSWPKTKMRRTSYGGNALTGWRKSSLYGDGPLEAYARDNNGAPCEFTWISTVAEADPRHRPGGTGDARTWSKVNVGLDVKKSGDADAGANTGLYLKLYNDDGQLVGYQTIWAGTLHSSYSGNIYGWGGEYSRQLYHCPEDSFRNWVQNYGSQTGDFWSIAYRGIEPSGDLWYNYFYAKIWVE